MNKTELSAKARDAEFVHVCLAHARRSRASGENTTLFHIIDRALHTQPRCHYVNYEYASKVLHGMENCGAEAACSNRLHHLKWTELHGQVREAMDGPRKLTFCKALTFVLAFRRPSRFYISHRHAMRLISPYLFTRSTVQLRNPSC